MKPDKDNLLEMPRPRRKPLNKRVADLLDAVEERLRGDALKPSVTDFIRLFQIYKEFEKQKPRRIEVTWVDPVVNPQIDAA